MTQLNELSLDEAARLVSDSQVSSRELVESCLAAIDRMEPETRALLARFDDHALDEADRADRDRAGGCQLNPLFGIPIVIKDVIDVAGSLTTAASAVLAKNYVENDAEPVRRLRERRAIILGKANTHEFAYGARTPPTSNPWGGDRIPGGSSGGSAAAVATGMAYGALGTDTLGSIREPAAFCGVVGFKPTFDRVSTRGVVPLARSFDTVGPLARTVEDCGHLYSVMADKREMREVTPSDSPDRTPSPRIGAAAEAFDILQAEVGQVVASTLSGWGLDLDRNQVELGDLDELSEVAYLIVATEAARFHRAWFARVPHLYGEEVAERIAQGLKTTDEAYGHALARRDQIRARLLTIFDQVDIIALPTVMVTAPSKSVGASITVEGNCFGLGPAMTRLLAPFSLVGFPSISIPVGFDDAKLPIGLQLVAKPFDDENLLHWSAELHRETPWTGKPPVPLGHRRLPTVDSLG